MKFGKTNTVALKIDFHQIVHLSEGNEAFKTQVLSLLREQAVDLMHELEKNEEGVENEQNELVQKAHKFKSSVHIVSSEGHELINQLEKAAKKENEEKLEFLQESSLQFCKELIAKIDSELS